jgi:hypothetical protein
MTCTCAQCGAPFEAVRTNARFCSGKCRAAASKRRAAGVGEAFAVAGVDLPARPGRVRADLAAHLASTGVEEHPLASGLLALADRLDRGNDPLTGLSAALRQLESTLATIVGRSSREANFIDVLRLRHLVRRAAPEAWPALAEALTPEAMAKVAAYSRRQFDSTLPRTTIPEETP